MINLVNSSFNYAQEISSNYIHSSLSLKFQYSSLVSNAANAHGLLSISSIVITHPNLKSLNIVNNSQLTSTGYLITNPGCQLSLKDCIFLQYNQTLLFGGNNV